MAAEGTTRKKPPSLHRLGGGVQQEFEHSFRNRNPFGLSKDWIKKSLWLAAKPLWLAARSKIPLKPHIYEEKREGFAAYKGKLRRF
jgi:hypothetical protein